MSGVVTTSMESERHRHCMLEIILIESACRVETNGPRASNKSNPTMRHNRQRLKALNVAHWQDQPLLPRLHGSCSFGRAPHASVRFSFASMVRFRNRTQLEFWTSCRRDCATPVAGPGCQQYTVRRPGSQRSRPSSKCWCCFLIPLEASHGCCSGHQMLQCRFRSTATNVCGVPTTERRSNSAPTEASASVHAPWTSNH